MARPYTIRGYHATEPAKAQNIMRDGFRRSDNWYDWLGLGVYFYQDSAQFAWDWAKNHRKEGKIPNAVVLGADIQVDGLMDLADARWDDLIHDAYLRLEQAQESRYLAAKTRQKPWTLGRLKAGAHPLDREVVEEAIASFPASAIRAVRGVFVEGEFLFPGSHLFKGQHIQVAVRDISIIGPPWIELS